MQPAALVLLPEIAGEIVREEVGAIALVGISSVDFAESVVKGGIEWAGGNERAELGNRLSSRAEIFGFESAVDVDGMTILAIGGSDGVDLFGEGLHGRESLIVGKNMGWERPNVAHGHGAEAFGGAAVWEAHHTIDVEESDAVNRKTAEFVGSAVAEILIGVGDFLDADGCWIRFTESRRGHDSAGF